MIVGFLLHNDLGWVCLKPTSISHQISRSPSAISKSGSIHFWECKEKNQVFFICRFYLLYVIVCYSSQWTLIQFYWCIFCTLQIFTELFQNAYYYFALYFYIFLNSPCISRIMSILTHLGGWQISFFLLVYFLNNNIELACTLSVVCIVVSKPTDFGQKLSFF